VQAARNIAEMPIAPQRDRPTAARVPRSWQGETRPCRNPQCGEVLWAVGLPVYCDQCLTEGDDRRDRARARRLRQAAL